MSRQDEIRQNRPLPQDILNMGTDETACEYCGISYLILTKCEKMEELVKEMEDEQNKLKARM
jgi:hypothetical protein